MNPDLAPGVQRFLLFLTKNLFCSSLWFSLLPLSANSATDPGSTRQHLQRLKLVFPRVLRLHSLLPHPWTPPSQRLYFTLSGVHYLGTFQLFALSLLLFRDRFGFLLALAHGISSEVYLEGVVEQPVAYCVSGGRVADIRMPVVYGA